MIKVPAYDKNNRRQIREQLPKGGYVCKIMNIEEMTSQKGKQMVKISFDIAEGDYKDFYATQYKADTSEDKKWSNDATYYLTIPYDDCEAWITKNWDTFWADIEDSNNGYVFDGNEKTVKGKTFGGVFRIEEREYNGTTYTNTRLAFTTIAQNIRDGKFRTAEDKLLPRSSSTDSSFMEIPEDAVNDLPF